MTLLVLVLHDATGSTIDSTHSTMALPRSTGLSLLYTHSRVEESLSQYSVHPREYSALHVSQYIGYLCSDMVHSHPGYIRESVDSLCGDGADAQYMQYA